MGPYASEAIAVVVTAGVAAHCHQTRRSFHIRFASSWTIKEYSPYRSRAISLMTGAGTTGLATTRASTNRAIRLVKRRAQSHPERACAPLGSHLTRSVGSKIRTELAASIGAASRQLDLGAVAVVGAGLSIDARFPLTSGLNVLLWDSLDSDAVGRAEVAHTLGRPDALSKQLVGDEPAAVALAWSALRRRPEGRFRFQAQFAELDRERSALPSPAHDALARLVHAKVIELVVSLNWDTALERAYERLYGVSLPEGILHKPHGDAANPKSKWVLPDQPGLITPELLETAKSLASTHARTLLVVGYSSSDAVIVDELIQPLDATWRTIRVGPHAKDEGDLAGQAAVVLTLLAEPIAEALDAAAWHPVTFSGSRGITAAFRGERLTPLDIDACPELVEAELIRHSLLEDHAVVLNGPTGSGKSISAYQALRKLANAGFEVLRLRDDARRRGVRSWISDLRLFPWPKVLFIDDAQDLTADAVREFSEHADDQTMILFAGIDHVAGGVRTLRLSSSAAVARLAQWVKDERETAFKETKALDDQVGTHPLDIQFENRIAVAERQPTPWLFFYILTGGWRRIGRELLELRDANRADQLLLAIAVAQIAGVDAGVAKEDLQSWVNVLGRDTSWSDRSLNTLRERRLINESEGRIRCTHLETAYSIVRWMLHILPTTYHPTEREAVPSISSAPPAVPPRKAAPLTLHASPSMPVEQIREDRESTERLISAALDSSDSPLRGVAWLIGSHVSSDVRDHLRRTRILDGNRYMALATRALDCPADGDIASAANLLTEIVTWAERPEMKQTLLTRDAGLRAWYSAISPENAWALGDLVNAIYHVDKDYAATVSGYCDPALLASLMPKGGWPHSASTGRALDRLCNVGGAPVRSAVQTHLNPADYLQMLHYGDPELGRMSAYLEHVVSIDHRLAVSLFEEIAPRLARQFSADPVREWNELGSLMIQFGCGPTFLRGGKRPLRDVARVVRKFIGLLNTGRIAQAFEGPTDQWGQLNFGEFISLLAEFDPATLEATVGRMDLERFEGFLAAATADSRGTHFYAALRFSEFRESEIHDILDRLEPGWSQLDPLAAGCAPDVGIRALKRGLPLDLGLDHHHWGLAAFIVNRICQHDPVVASELIEANRGHLRSGLIATNHSDPWEDLAKWTEVCDRVTPGYIDGMIASLPIGAVAGWGRALRRPDKYHKSRRADIAPLVLRAAVLTGHVGDEAAELLKKYPTIMRKE